LLIDRSLVEAALPGYQVEGDLGKGGYGLVLAGQHRLIGRKVAIKILLDTSDDPDLRARFLSEARVLAELDHPHIVRIHDYVEHDGTCLLVMELLSGGTLKQRISASRLNQESVCAIGMAAATALATAHSQGVLHRDVKPDNIMFDGTGLLKVTDFGIAKIFDGAETTASAILGTPRYMAPEQIIGGRLYPSTDLYALAGVLYEMFAERPMFGRPMAVQPLTHHHLNIMPEPLTMVPPAVAAVIMRTLGKDPAARLPDATEFALELARAGARSFGPNWLSRSEIRLRVEDEVREAALGTSSTPNPPFSPRPGIPPTGPAGYRGGTGPTPGGYGTPYGSGPQPGQPQPQPRQPQPRQPQLGQPQPGQPQLPRTGPQPGQPYGTRPQPPTGPAYPAGPNRPATPVAPTRPLTGPGAWPGQTPPAQTPPPQTPPARPLPPGPPARPGAAPGQPPAYRPTGGWPAAGQPGQPVHHPGTGQPGQPHPQAGHRQQRPGGAPQGLFGLSRRATWIAAGLVLVLIAGLATAIGLAAAGGGGGGGGDGARTEAYPGQSVRRPATSVGYAGPALAIPNLAPYGLTLGDDGTLFIASLQNDIVHKIAQDGAVTPVAGTGATGFAGDGGPATAAQLNGPGSVARDPAGDWYVTDALNFRVRKITPDGKITTVVGTGTKGFSGDGGPAAAAQINGVEGIAIGDDGSLYLPDYENQRLRKVTPNGIITTIAGTGTKGYAGTPTPATSAALDGPNGVVIADDGTIYLSNLGSDTVQKIDKNGTLSTVAGINQDGYSGDGGPASSAKLSVPAIALDGDGTLYISDYGSNRIRKVSPQGIITTIAGTGTAGKDGDGGPATAATFKDPSAVVVDANGAVYVADSGNKLVRRISPDGTITTVARQS
jgi:serine/threonine-protein kinase